MFIYRPLMVLKIRARVRSGRLSETLRFCFFGGFAPGCSKRNCVRSLTACADGAPLPPMADRVYRNSANSRHLGDSKHSAFAKAIEAAL